MRLLTLAVLGWSCDKPIESDESDAAVDADGDADTDTPPADESLAADDRILDCEGGDTSLIAPKAGSEHHWLAVRLSPNPQWSFVPAQFTYTMEGGETSGPICHSNYAHEIMIWTQRRTENTADPPWSPFVISVPADTGPDDDDDYERTEDLEGSGIVVDPGEDLFVALQLNGSFPDVACPRVCTLDEEVFPPGRVLWASTLDERPFNFFDLSEKRPDLGGLDYVVTGSYESYD